MKNKNLFKILSIIVIIILLFVGCHKKKKPFLLLPLVDSASTVDSGSGSGGSGGGSGGFTEAVGELDPSFNGNGYI